MTFWVLLYGILVENPIFIDELGDVVERFLNRFNNEWWLKLQIRHQQASAGKPIETS